MRPQRFLPRAIDWEGVFVRDQVQGVIWHHCTNRTLYADTDRAQVVYHANYLRYFEIGRATLMRDIAFPYKEIEQSGYIYPIISLNLDFYNPLFYDDLMSIYTKPAELERVKIKFEYIIMHEQRGEMVCKGYTKHCATNSAGTPVEIDPKTMKLWQKFQDNE